MGMARAGRRFLLRPNRPVSFGPSSLFAPDPSDFFDTPISITGETGDYTTGNRDRLTVESGESEEISMYDRGYTTTYSVDSTQWFYWECPSEYDSYKRQYFYSDDSDTFVQILTGSQVDDLTDVGTTLKVLSPEQSYSVSSFVPTPNEFYYIRIGVTTGIVSVVAGTGEPPVPPVYSPDTKEGAVTLTGQLFSGSNSGYASEAQGNVGWYGAWFKWTPEFSDTVVISTEGSSFDTILKIYDASDNLIDEDDDSGPGVTSEITFACTAFEVYYIVVCGYNSVAYGDFNLVYPPVEGYPG